MRAVHSRATPTTVQHRHRFIAVRVAAAAAPTTTLVTKQRQRQQRQVFKYSQIELETGPGVSIHDITPQIKQAVEEAGISDGFVNVLSRHTTTAVAINEYELRLLDDIRQWLRKLAPPSDPYLHNDLHLRSGPPDWPGGDEAWRAQEPINAHSHLLSLMLGNSGTVPVAGRKLKTGTWQSVLLVELDGPRPRTVGVQVVGVVDEEQVEEEEEEEADGGAGGQE